MVIHHHRRSIRLRGYDYTLPGAYFITMNTFQREHFFGRIIAGEMHLSTQGEIAREEWRKTAELRPYVTLDEFCIMPNHVHGIIIINEDDSMGSRTGDRPVAPTDAPTVAPTAHSLPAIVRAYKSAVTKRINEINDTPGTPIWQRNYYEHIIRGDPDLARIREYIIHNPLRCACHSEGCSAA